MSRKADSVTPIRTRLYVEAPLAAGHEVVLAAGQAHYLRSVLRAVPGQSVGLFNGRDGEWRGEIGELGRSTAAVRVAELRRGQQASPDVRLCFAPLKKSAIDLVGEKATELGVSRISPVMTEFTAVSRVNTARLHANAVEAAEQCERLDVPQVDEPEKLADMLASWPAGQPLLLCAEAGEALPITEAAARLKGDSYGLLIGPEGGFSSRELDRLTGLPFVQPVGLGPRILRADTAAIAALAICQALGGNMASRPPDEAAFYSRQDH